MPLIPSDRKTDLPAKARSFGLHASVVIIGLMGLHWYLTGSPIPLWHMERLHQPAPVASFTTNSITLADGRILSAPELSIIPVCVASNLFQHGVEIDPRGEIFVLAVFRPWCGNDPYRYISRRVTLKKEAVMWTIPSRPSPSAAKRLSLRSDRQKTGDR
ncbi:MAG: hypothetical protein V2A34_11065 [Lentisphaerota bacterium]